MGIISDLSYNYHKGSAESYIKRKFNSDDESYNKFKSNYTKELDAFCNAYAEAENVFPDKTRYENASDKELQNWALAKEMRKNTGYTLFKSKNF